MAVEVVRRLTYGDGWLTVDLTYDNADGVTDPDLVWWRVECHSPVPLRCTIWRGGNVSWRQGIMNDGDVLEGGSQGPVRKLLDIGGIQIEQV